MLTKLFAALMTVMLCLGFTPTPTTQTEPAAPAKNNTVIEASTGIPQPTTTVLLTAQEAEDIALERAALTREAVTFSRTEFDRDNGRPEWEVEFRSGDWEYDCTVHAETGRVLEWDKEYDPEKPTASQPTVTEPPVTEPPAGQLTSSPMPHSPLAGLGSPRQRAGPQHPDRRSQSLPSLVDDP